MVLEILTIRSLESCNSWLHLFLEFKENMPAEAFTELGKFLDKTSIVTCQHDEDFDWHFFRVLYKWFNLILAS